MNGQSKGTDRSKIQGHSADETNKGNYVIRKMDQNNATVGKGKCTALKKQTPHRATEPHLSYGITQCYLPPDRGERAAP